MMSSLVADYGNSSDSNSSIESNELQDKERYVLDKCSFRTNWQDIANIKVFRYNLLYCRSTILFIL